MMGYNDISRRSSILRAVEECNSLGQEQFLQKYGFGKARNYFLEINGVYYDSKAIVGVAHKYEFPSEGPLKSDEFSGGRRTVMRKLENLQFNVEVR